MTPRAARPPGRGPLYDRVLGSIRRESLIPQGGRVVVALSGGGDSVALTLLLSQLAERAPFKVVGVAERNISPV